MTERFKKLRGGRRYFRRLPEWPDSVRVTLGGDHWYDFWHSHPDGSRWSLRDGRARRAHLRVLFAAFRRVLHATADSAEPGQVFVTVCTKEGHNDALYVHTPNPNADNYPYDFAGCSWNLTQVPPLLAEFVSLDEFEIGQTVFEGEKRYVVVPTGPRGRPSKP